MAVAARSKRILVSFRLVEALSDVLQGLGAYVRKRQLNWQFHCVDADEFVAYLRPGVVDGALAVISPGQPDVLPRVRRSPVPVVNMLHDLHPLLPSVLSDDRGLGRTAAEYLLGRGFRHFAYVGFHSVWSHERYQSFSATLSAAGHECITGGPDGAFSNVTDYRFFNTARGAARLTAWVKRLPAPVAVLGCSDLVAAATLGAVARAGLRVPEDVAVLGVDNLVATCELAPVPLSSVAQDFTALGFEAARVLERVIAGGSLPAAPVLVPPGAVVGRRSTDVLAFRDEYVSAAMRVIHARAADGITMKELLQLVPVSRRWLDTRFKLAVGRTASDEMRRLRLARVRDLLLHTDLSVKQIAMRCGFSRPANMTRFFRDAHGAPPQAFRTRHGRAR